MTDPNDDRSDAMNPNNDAFQDSADNRANQLNPEHPEYAGPDRGAEEDDD